MFGEMTCAYRVLLRAPEGRDHLEVLGVDCRIILKWILNKSVRRLWTRLIWLRIGTRHGLL
jgi:hypothetical protein